ncbi:sodium-translocating pyrophosphatase, partial [Candidatus Nomurabacteria bacterium]|nr:sodium-translocating pyrophosphatase [Candidatus Nomurabacteria bacterium]
MLGFVALAAIAALGLAAVNFFAVKKMGTGTPLMEEIAGAIKEGADAFIKHEYGVIAKIAAVIAVLLGVVVTWQTGVAFILGALMSGSAGW